MPPSLTGVAWAQVRYDYEHTERPIEEICAEHGISSGTLRDRVRRWGWARRREPIPREGPPPLPAPRIEAPPLAIVAPPSTAHVLEAATPSEIDDGAIVPRLQSAVARVLPAIEATVARLAVGAAHPRELEQAGRALGALTRALRELSNLLRQGEAPAANDPAQDDRADDDDGPEDIEEFRRELARRMNAIVAARGGEVPDDA